MIILLFSFSNVEILYGLPLSITFVECPLPLNTIGREQQGTVRKQLPPASKNDSHS